MQVIELDEPVYDPNSPTGFTTGTDGYRQFGAGEWLGPWGGGGLGLEPMSCASVVLYHINRSPAVLPPCCSASC